MGTVDDAGDDLVDWERAAVVDGGNANEFLWVVEWLLVRTYWCSDGLWPVEVGDGAACQNQCVSIVHGKVISNAGSGGVHLSTTKVLLRDDLSGGSLHQRWASKENVTLLSNNDRLVRHCWNVCTASGTWSHHNSDLWDALRRHARLIVEDAPKVVAVWEDIGLMRQVGTTRIDEVDTSEQC